MKTMKKKIFQHILNIHNKKSKFVIKFCHYYISIKIKKVILIALLVGILYNNPGMRTCIIEITYKL